MNRFRSGLSRAALSTASWLRTLYANTSAATVHSLSLVPNYLANLLWLINTKYLNLARESYGGSPVVYACLNTLCRGIAEPPLLAYVETQDGTTEPLPTSHPLSRLIRQPNEMLTQYLSWFLTGLHMGVIGRSLWWKERNNAGQVIALWPLRPDRCGPVYSGSDTPNDKVISGWSYLMDNQHYVFIPRQDMIAFLWPDPTGESGGMVEGLGPCQVLAREVSADNAATLFVGSLVANYASPATIITTKVPIRNKEDAQLIKAGFIQEFGGVKQGMPAVIDADTTVTSVGFNLRELEFPDLRSIAETRISAAFGVPAALVGLKAGLDRATYNNLDGLRKYFAETTLEASWRQLEDAFTNQVAVEFGPNLVCRFDRSKVRALIEQTRMEIQPIKEAFALGVVMVDEYREKVLNLPPMASGQGQVFFIPNTITVAVNPLLEVAASDGASPGTGQAPLPGDEPAQLPPPSRAEAKAVIREVVMARTARRRTHLAPPPVGVGRRHALRAAEHGTVAAAEKAQRVAIRARQGYESVYAPRYHALFAKAAKALAYRLDGSTRDQMPNIDGGVLDDLDAAIAELLAAQWVQILEERVAEAAGQVRVALSFDLANPHVADVIADLAERIAGINATTREDVQRVVNAGMAVGDDMQTLAERLRALPDNPGVFSEARAVTIARTESGTAYNRASALGWRLSEVVDSVRIADGTDFDEPCRDVNGTIQTLEWFESHPLQHPRCTRAASPIANS